MLLQWHNSSKKTYYRGILCVYVCVQTHPPPEAITRSQSIVIFPSNKGEGFSNEAF